MKLQPCPFCGSAAKMVRDIIDVRDGTFMYMIFCTNIYCDKRTGWRFDADLLAKEWNRRTNDGETD